jgi:hypothetical protein
MKPRSKRGWIWRLTCAASPDDIEIEPGALEEATAYAGPWAVCPSSAP